MNAINEHWHLAPDTSVLRLVTAGSVDDGKSTLIGRLLLDSKGVFADQLKAVAGSRYSRAPENELDLALLTDGLEAEREQGITIDVAYRYFATPARKFIIADAPGHEQYTRNMVTGASTADAAVILVDASRVADGNLMPQTKRHATLARLLGLRHVVVAVNKMDRVDWDRAVFERIQASCQDLAQHLGIPSLQSIPLSALTGDNVVHSSEHTPWYQGLPLLSLLESLPVDGARQGAARFFVQWVIRHNGSTAQAFRGYAGQLHGGQWQVGDRVRILPGGETAAIRELWRGAEIVKIARPGDSITVVLDREVDISRGDLLVDDEASQPTLAQQFQAELCWLDREALNPARWYWLKQGSRLTQARVRQVLSRRDIRELSTVPWQGELSLNDIGKVQIQTCDTLALDDYDVQRATGAFILIDHASHQTVAAGMVRV